MKVAERKTLRVRELGLRNYQEIWQAMRDFTDQRTDQTCSELWIVQHPPVFTQGQAGKAAHLLAPGDIPVVQSDRGGQVTYHGPGQLVIYLLLSLREAGVGIRQLVNILQDSVIDLLAKHGIQAETRAGAPGVYVDGCKIAALGLRVRRGFTYHGLALNVNNDLAPFGRINPCGFAGLEVTSTERLGVDTDLQTLAHALVQQLASSLDYRTQSQTD